MMAKDKSASEKGHDDYIAAVRARDEAAEALKKAEQIENQVSVATAPRYCTLEEVNAQFLGRSPDDPAPAPAHGSAAAAQPRGGYQTGTHLPSAGIKGGEE